MCCSIFLHFLLAVLFRHDLFTPAPAPSVRRVGAASISTPSTALKRILIILRIQPFTYFALVCLLFVVLVFLFRLFLLLLVSPLSFLPRFVVNIFMDGFHASLPPVSFSWPDGWPYSFTEYISMNGQYWDAAASVRCDLWVISRRYMTVDLKSILIPQLGLELDAGATVVAGVPAHHSVRRN